MSNHTKEPWRVGKFGCVVSDDVAPGINGSDAVDYYGGHLVGESINEQNARRIVACVNACAGIPTDILEISAANMLELSAARANCAKWASEAVNAKKQNSELLTDLKEVVICAEGAMNQANADGAGWDIEFTLQVANELLEKGGAA